jgi:hypothetical protein
MLATERQAIVKEFEDILEETLIRFKIGKGVREYERAKRLVLNEDMGTGEYRRAIKVIAEWCEV